MKTSSWIVLLSASALFLASTSCSSVSKFGASSIALVKKTTSATTSKVSELSAMAVNKINPPGVKVVEVREKDLKKLPTGKERALAYQNTRKSFWFFDGPVDFQEPNLPETGGDPDGSLLPPIAQ
jgi:hypothetical protein